MSSLVSWCRRTRYRRPDRRTVLLPLHHPGNSSLRRISRLTKTDRDRTVAWIGHMPIKSRQYKVWVYECKIVPPHQCWDDHEHLKVGQISSDTSSWSLRERHHVVLEVLDIRLQPSLRKECFGIWEELLAMMECPCWDGYRHTSFDNVTSYNCFCSSLSWKTK